MPRTIAADCVRVYEFVPAVWWTRAYRTRPASLPMQTDEVEPRRAARRKHPCTVQRNLARDERRLGACGRGDEKQEDDGDGDRFHTRQPTQGANARLLAQGCRAFPDRILTS